MLKQWSSMLKQWSSMLKQWSNNSCRCSNNGRRCSNNGRRCSNNGQTIVVDAQTMVVNAQTMVVDAPTALSKPHNRLQSIPQYPPLKDKVAATQSHTIGNQPTPPHHHNHKHLLQQVSLHSTLSWDTAKRYWTNWVVSQVFFGKMNGNLETRTPKTSTFESMGAYHRYTICTTSVSLSSFQFVPSLTIVYTARIWQPARNVLLATCSL